MPQERVERRTAASCRATARGAGRPSRAPAGPRCARTTARAGPPTATSLTSPSRTSAASARAHVRGGPPRPRPVARRSSGDAAPIAASERSRRWRRASSIGSGGDRGGLRQHPLHRREALVEVAPRVHADPAGLPQVVERVGRGLPRPPAAALAHVRRPLEVRVAERPARGDRLLDRVHDRLVLPPGNGGAGGSCSGISAMNARQMRQVLGGDEAGDVREVLEQDAATVDQPLERVAVVLAEAAPQRHVVRAIEHVDRVDLQAAGGAHEVAERARLQRPAAGPVEPLAFEEQRRRRAARDRGTGHAPDVLRIHTPHVIRPACWSVTGNPASLSASLIWPW